VPSVCRDTIAARMEIVPQTAAPTDEHTKLEPDTADLRRGVRRRRRRRVWRAAALAATFALALSMVVAQPLRSPWWTYADADAAYAASSLNELLGEPIRYLDHPGLPLEELGTLVFGAQELGERVTGSVSSRRAFVDRELLNLDRARPVFRGIAAVLYLLGAMLSFLVAERLFGHWTFGLAAGLLWLGAPGLTAMSIQFRPDVAVCVLLVGFAYLVGRGVDRRSAGNYLGAGLLLGLATMTKMHAAGALPALLIAVVWRPPRDGWNRGIRERITARRTAFGVAVAVWAALAALMNVLRGTSPLTGEQLFWLLVPPLVLAGYVAIAIAVRMTRRNSFAARVLDPFYGIVLLAVVAGLWIPVTLSFPDGRQALVNIAHGLTGGGINSGIPLFQASLDQLKQEPLRQATFVFVLALIGLIVGIARRDPKPVAWAVAATVLAVMAEARLAAVHYFAPAYVLSVFGALWLVKTRSPGAASLLVWPLVLYVALPAWNDRHGPAAEANAFAGAVAPAKAELAARLQQGEVALVPSYWPFADARYFELVHQYVTYTPPYAYRTLPAIVPAAEFAGSNGLRLRYYVGPGLPQTDADADAFVGQLDVYTVRRVPGSALVYQLIHGPGADALWQRPDAHYDPWTGYYKDAAGQYWNALDQPIQSPPQRRYLDREHLWVDAYGDLWDADGRSVGNRPDLRTAP
jgi:hypothetical protein